MSAEDVRLSRRLGLQGAADDIELVARGVDGVPIAVRIRPSTGSVPALLVHGFGSSGKANWSGTGWLTALDRAGIPGITVDVRGHGLSGKPHRVSEYSLPIIVADVFAALAAASEVLGPMATIDLIGYSLGGRVVGELVAAATGAASYPARQSWPIGLPEVRRAVIGGYDGRPLFTGIDDQEYREFAKAIAGEHVHKGPGSRVARIAMATPGNDLVALSALVKGLSAKQTELPAAAVGIPVLAVAGDRDSITDSTLAWSDEMPNGRHLILPGRTHISAVTSSVFRAAATEFLLED